MNGKIPLITDTEGVLVNTFDRHFVPISNLVRKRKGLPPLPPEYREHARVWRDDVVKEFEIDDENSRRLYEELWTKWLLEEISTELYSVEELLSYLQTNTVYFPILKSSSRRLSLLIARFRLGKYFPATVLAPDPRTPEFMENSFEQAVTNGHSTSVCIFIDDASENLETAKRYGESKNIRILTIGVTYGFYSHQKIKEANPDRIAHAPNEVLAYLIEFENTFLR